MKSTWARDGRSRVSAAPPSVPNALRGWLASGLVIMLTGCAQGPSPGPVQRSPVDRPCQLELLDRAADCSRETLRGDLDADGVPELVVARRHELSGSWNVSIGPVDDTTPFLSWSDHAYGDGTFVQRADEPSCWILTTEWLRPLSPKPGDAGILIGRPFRYRQTRLEPVNRLDVVARVRTAEMASEMGRGSHSMTCSDILGAPLSWLRSDESSRPQRDPYLRRDATFRMQGTAQSVSVDDPLELVMQLSSQGWLLRLRYREVSEEGDENVFTRLGDARSGRLYPPGYRQRDAAAWLTGRTIVLSTYPQRDGEPHRVLWLE